MELSGCGAGPICPASCWLGNVIQSGCGPGCKSSGSRLGTAWSARESHVPLGSGQSVRQSQVPSEALALSNDTKHEPAWQLLGHSIYYAYEHRVGLTRAGIGVIAFALTCRPILVFPESYRA